MSFTKHMEIYAYKMKNNTCTCIFHCIRQKHKTFTFRHKVWKWNVTDSGACSTGTLALLNLLLTAQTLNYKSWVKWSARWVSDHVTNRRTSPKINTGSPAPCLHQRRNEISDLITISVHMHHLPWLECIQRRTWVEYLLSKWVLYCTKIFAPHHSLVTQ